MHRDVCHEVPSHCRRGGRVHGETGLTGSIDQLTGHFNEFLWSPESAAQKRNRKFRCSVHRSDCRLCRQAQGRDVTLTDRSGLPGSRSDSGHLIPMACCSLERGDQSDFLPVVVFHFDQHSSTRLPDVTYHEYPVRRSRSISDRVYRITPSRPLKIGRFVWSS